MQHRTSARLSWFALVSSDRKILLYFYVYIYIIFLVLVVLVGFVVFCLRQGSVKGVTLFVLTISYLQVLSTFCLQESLKLIPKEFYLLHGRVPELSSHVPAEWSGIRIGSFAFVIIKTPIITRALQEAIQEKLGWFCHFGWFSIKMVHEVTMSYNVHKFMRHAVSTCSKQSLEV